jgi:hypothetical protein
LRAVALVLSLLPWGLAVPDTLADTLWVGKFSAESTASPVPSHWQPYRFDSLNPTRYLLVKEGGATVIEAVSKASASGLVRRIDVDLYRFPVLNWSWKATSMFSEEDPHSKAGDDYPVRISVQFAPDSSRRSLTDRLADMAARAICGKDAPFRSISYVWSVREPIGKMVPNPYTPRSVTVVAASGTANMGRWMEIRRDVREDFRAAFNEEPPLVTSIGVMTDTDDTGNDTVSYYGDIWFGTTP